MRQLSFFPEVIADEWTPDDWRTPEWLAQKLAGLVQPHEQVIVDAGAGTGNITKFLPLDRTVHAVERSSYRVGQGKVIASHATWHCCSFLEFETKADLVIANPPFSEAIAFIEHSLSLINRSGRILFLMPLDWNCTKTVAKQWKRTQALIHHEYRIEGRVAYIDKDGKAQSGRQVCDAVFDIRKIGESAVSYL